MDNSCSGRKLTVLLVEDNGVVATQTEQAIYTHWVEEVAVEKVINWPDFLKQWANRIAEECDLVLCDINLKGDSPDSIINGIRVTEYDGLRVCGRTAKVAPHVSCVLYTGYAPATIALDEFNEPSSPMWVICKGDPSCINVVIYALAIKLGEAARALLYRIPLAKRHEAWEALSEGKTPCPVFISRTGRSPKVCYEWTSLLAAVQGERGPLGIQALEPQCLANALSTFLPRSFKALLLTRLCKPKEYEWGPETFGIEEPRKHLCSDCETPVEAILHIDDRVKCLPPWKLTEALDRAKSEYGLAKGALLESTRDLFDDVWKAADQVRAALSLNNATEVGKALQSAREAGGTLKGALWMRWSDILRGVLELNVNGAPGELLGYCHYAEWERLREALQLILASRSEACSEKVCAPSCSVRVTSTTGVWTLRMVLADRGKGIPALRSCFLTESDNVPTQSPAKTHKLQRAQALLWGYCRWAVHSKTGGNCQSYDVYGESETVEWENLPANGLVCGDSGTTHVLEFDNPLPKDWRPPNATYSL